MIRYYAVGVLAAAWAGYAGWLLFGTDIRNRIKRWRIGGWITR